MTELNVIKLSGSPHQIGIAHGEQLRQQIAETAIFYNEVLFRNQLGLIQDQGEQFLGIIEEFNADFAVEIRAIAKASEQPAWQIAALNARTEIYQQVEASPKSECTSAYFPGTRLLGQNWDWMKPMQQLVAVMEITLPDGHQILQLTEPGIIGKIGFNSSGVGVCLNILTGGASPPRVPVHILLRSALECRSITEFRNTLEGISLGTFSNILIADAEGESNSIEICGDHLRQVDYGSGPIVHTNHFLTAYCEKTDEATDDRFASSRQRYARGNALYGSSSSANIQQFKDLLANEDDAPLEICREYRLVEGNILGTVSSIIMDLAARELHITIGKCSQNTWHKVSFM
jgi:isopenicillin-N N-acyltransferase-like protein